MPRTGEKRLRGEYGNRVQIPDGTAAVCAESPRRKRKLPTGNGKGTGDRYQA